MTHPIKNTLYMLNSEGRILSEELNWVGNSDTFISIHDSHDVINNTWCSALLLWWRNDVTIWCENLFRHRNQNKSDTSIMTAICAHVCGFVCQFMFVNKCTSVCVICTTHIHFCSHTHNIDTDITQCTLLCVYIFLSISSVNACLCDKFRLR